jgi:molecular chaperone GrpE
MSSDPPKKRADESERCEKRLAEVEATLEEERQKGEKYLNQLKYARADLENLQKQVQRRIDEGVERGNERLVLQLLPVVEELDLAIEVGKKAESGGILEGIEMVRRKLGKVLSAEGLSPIDAVGRPFDPHLHEAVLEVETCDHPDGTVIEEVRKGYTFKGRVLRASMVKVARNPSSTETGEAKRVE